MREVLDRFFVGNQADYENLQSLILAKHQSAEEWAFALVAKEPWHRRAVGYTTRACDKNHPEYLIARRENKLILNLVDAPRPEFFSKSIIDEALQFIHIQLDAGKKVLLACNQGESRSASICLLYFVKHRLITSQSMEDCEVAFKGIYPEYNPGIGIRGFVKKHWEDYLGNK